ncbi:hypothetical protein GS597_13795 [Synechococcales cyanobacterium C]|uniref:Uncharacterized protein n=1 Tax=Petrachloros mirabilis ULC683 TaxID=2781853 RepID=A0A8K1ZZ95_9CYAN|nr:hypothetical protein [Petrachloros mirabilis]NCJ07563.1 hypothetical protein [Petrachloros mirabilis ULC683]
MFKFLNNSSLVMVLHMVAFGVFLIPFLWLMGGFQPYSHEEPPPVKNALNVAY